MAIYPVVFTYEELVKGHGFLAGVLARGRALMVHEDDERLSLLVLHHQRLHHLVLGHAQRLRRHAGAAMLDVRVRMLGVADVMRPQERGRGRVSHGDGASREAASAARDRVPAGA